MPPSPLRFRRAQGADVPAIVALVESAYRGDASRAGWTTEADLLDGQRTDAAEVHAQMDNPRACMVLGEDDAGICASILVKDDDGTGYIGMFAVDPRRQGGGLGAAMLAEAERVARDELALRQAKMTVIVQREELIAWYVRRGWTRTDEREPFPYGEPRAGTPRRADLEFVVLRKDLRR